MIAAKGEPRLGGTARLPHLPDEGTGYGLLVGLDRLKASKQINILRACRLARLLKIGLIASHVTVIEGEHELAVDIWVNGFNSKTRCLSCTRFC